MAPQLNKTELEQMYTNEQLSSIKIANEIGVDDRTIRRWLCKYHIPRRSQSDWMNGFRHPFYGKNHTKETKKKISISKKGKPCNSPTRTKKGQHLSLSTEFKKGLIPKNRKVFSNKKEFEIFYIHQKLSTLEIAKRLKTSPTTVLRWLKRYNILRRSLSKAKELACLEGRAKFFPPSQPELKFMDLCQRHGFPFKYTGDGSFWIGYPPLNPDFIHSKKRIVIEIFGDYWHRNDNPQERINAFKKYGWGCQVFWEHELDNLDAIIRTIEDFLKEHQK